MESKNTIPESNKRIKAFKNETGYSLADIWRAIIALNLKIEIIRGFKVLNPEQQEQLKSYLGNAEKEYLIIESKMNN